MNIPLNPNGQATGANSSPIVWASDIGLPSGANTIGTVTQVDTNITGTISATDILAPIPAGNGILISTAPTVNSFISALVPGGSAQADIQIIGTATGTYYFEGSMDSTTGSDGNWTAVNYRQTGITNTVLGYSTIAVGVYRGAPSGFKYIRVRNVGGTTPSNAIIFRYSNGGGTTFLNASIPSGINAIGKVAIDQTTNIIAATTMQNAAVALGNGTNLNVQGYVSALISITGTMTTNTAVTFEVSTDDITFVSIAGHQIGIAGNLLSTTTNTGDFRFNIAGYKSIRARVSVYGSGSITVKGYVSALAGHSTTVNANVIASLPSGINTIGTVNIATGTTINTVNVVSAVTAITNALPVGANTIGAVTNANLDVALSTRLKPADILAGVTTVGAVTAITNALPTGTNTIGAVNQQAITKGTQGTLGITTQDLKDAGRNQVHYYTLIPVLSTATDTLQSLTGTKANTTVTATATPAVVTTAKTFRVTRLAATYIATAVSGYGIVRLRYQPAGVVTITSPIAATLLVGAGAPTTANSTASEEAALDEGWEFAAATGVGISVQGFAAVTPTAVGYVLVSVTGYEY